MNLNITIRKAEKKDIPEIFRLLAFYSAMGIVLPRSPEDIEFYLGNFTVAESNDEPGRLFGCAAARDFGNNLYEIRSLAVDETMHGNGIGRKLVEGIINNLRHKAPKIRVFALTYQENFFCRLGFERVERGLFPEKIWSDCVNCRKKDCCDETAVLKQL